MKLIRILLAALLFLPLFVLASCQTTGGAPEVRHEVAEEGYQDLLEAAEETEALVDWAFKVNGEEAAEANLRELPKKIRGGAEALMHVNMMADAELAGKPVAELFPEGDADETGN